MKKIITTLICLFMSIAVYSQKKNTKKSIAKSYTEAQALEYIEDYYNFYNSDERYANPEVRKISSNAFYVKVETCSGGDNICSNDFFWHSKVLVLTINSNGKYTVKEKPNY